MIQVWKRRFLLAALVFTMLLSSLAILVRHGQSARATAASLSGLGGKLPLMRIATLEMKQALTDFRSLLPSGYGSKTANSMLYERVDDLKMFFPGAVMTIAIPTEQSGGASVPFIVKAVNTNYGDFLTGLAAAQARTFPFVLIDKVSIGCEQLSRGGLEYTAAGTIVLPNYAQEGSRR